MYKRIQTLFRLILIISFAGGGSALADPMRAPDNSQGQTGQSEIRNNQQKQTGHNNKIPCTCRFQGRNLKLGTIACIRTPQGRLVQARCQMSLNNTTWKFTDTPCNREQPMS